MLNDTLKALIYLTSELPVGTNLGLLHMLWMLVSGALLGSRGGLFPGLQAIGLDAAGTRRAWAAFASGKWHIRRLVVVWKTYVSVQTSWEGRRHGGYRAIAVDVTAFWRPTLKGCPSQHYHPAAGRAQPAVIIGLVGEVGTLNGQRLAVPRAIERVHPSDGREARLWVDVLNRTRAGLGTDEVVVVDAGVKLSDLHAARIDRYVVRLARNFTGQRNVLPTHTRGRQPRYGPCVRPLARTYKGKPLAATPPDTCQTCLIHQHLVRVEVWHDLVLPKTVPAPTHQTFTVYAFHHPAFKQPWLLATSLSLDPANVYALYADRWAVEQLPLSAKQMLGVHRQFVHAPPCVQRLPELALLAGSILSLLAASHAAIPTGFWDRHPKPTPGRFRRSFFAKPFPKDAALPGNFRKKQSATAHLPKGFHSPPQSKAA